MMFRPLSVRMRLTLWYLAALTLIISAFSVGIYLFTRAEFLGQLQTQLDAEVAWISPILGPRGRPICRRWAVSSNPGPATSPPTGRRWGSAVPRNIRVRIGSGVFFAWPRPTTHRRAIKLFYADCRFCIGTDRSKSGRPGLSLDP